MIYVGLALVAAGFVLGLFALVPDDQPEMRTAIMGLLMLAGQAAVARWIVGHVYKSGDVSRETSAQVSRETKRKKRRGKRRCR